MVGGDTVILCKAQNVADGNAVDDLGGGKPIHNIKMGKRLDAHVADKLLRDGRVRLKDCKSAKGKTYNATVLLGTEPDGRSKFSLEFENGGC